MKKLKLLSLLAFAGASADNTAVQQQVAKPAEQSIKSKIGLHVNVGGGYATHTFDQPFTVKPTAETMKAELLNEKVNSESNRVHNGFGVISVQVAYDMGNDFYIGGTAGLNYLLASSKVAHPGISIDEYKAIGKTLGDDKDFMSKWRDGNSIKTEIQEEAEKVFGWKNNKGVSDELLKNKSDALKDTSFSLSHGPMIFVGAMAGKMINDKLGVEVGLNFTMRSLEGVYTAGQNEIKTKYDMSLGIMPSLKVKYAFHSRVAAFLEAGFNMALSDKVQQDGKDVVGLAMGHTFIASVGVSAKVM